jgi:hypothetical protein
VRQVTDTVQEVVCQVQLAAERGGWVRKQLLCSSGKQGSSKVQVVVMWFSPTGARRQAAAGHVVCTALQQCRRLQQLCSSEGGSGGRQWERLWDAGGRQLLAMWCIALQQQKAVGSCAAVQAAAAALQQ